VARRPPRIGQLYGTCPALSADPLSVCYDAGTAVRQASEQQWQILALRARAGVCWAPGSTRTIPTTAIMRDPSGVLHLEPFAVEWKEATTEHWWTVLTCSPRTTR